MTAESHRLSREIASVGGAVGGLPAGSNRLRRAAVLTATASCVWLLVRLVFAAAMEVPVPWWGRHVVFPLPSGLQALLTAHEVLGSAAAVSMQYVLVAVVALLLLRRREIGRRRWLRVCALVALTWAVLDAATYCALAAYRTTIDEAATAHLMTSGASSVSHGHYEVTALVCLAYVVQYLPSLGLACLVFWLLPRAESAVTSDVRPGPG